MVHSLLVHLDFRPPSRCYAETEKSRGPESLCVLPGAQQHRCSRALQELSGRVFREGDLNDLQGVFPCRNVLSRAQDEVLELKCVLFYLDVCTVYCI